MSGSQFVAMVRAFHANADCRIQIAEFGNQSERAWWRGTTRNSKKKYGGGNAGAQLGITIFGRRRDAILPLPSEGRGIEGEG
jgi:hypothetical protein